MKTFGKKITLFLIDGDASGRIAAEISNWTGKIFKIPRTLIKDSANREELASTGIYFLFGKNPEDDAKDLIYIGEAESLIDRLRQHLSSKEFWVEAVCVVSKDENLNKAHVKYLEKRLYELAQMAGRYTIENSTIPAKTAISEADQAEMEEFLENLKLIIPTVGYKVFEEIDKRQRPESHLQIRDYFIEAVRGANAKGFISEEGFVVKKDSIAALETAPAMVKSNYFKLREKLIADGILILESAGYRFTKDHLFSSPSAAAAIVMGRSANGRTEWIDSSGKTIEMNEA